MKAEIRCAASIMGIRFWELNVSSGDKKHRITINVSEMRRRGITNSLNGTKKVTSYLNETEEGQQYLAEKIGLPKAIGSTASPSEAAAETGLGGEQNND